MFVSGNQLAAHNPDNITVSPRGGVVLCEDGGESPDQYGPGARADRPDPTAASRIYLAKNNVELTSPPDRRRRQDRRRGRLPRQRVLRRLLGPDGRTLFVNIQTPGITFAITGPWERGHL